MATQIALPKLQMSFSSSAQEIESAHDFLSISFSRHMEILNKTSTMEERWFYIQHAAAYKWDKYIAKDSTKDKQK